MQFEAVAEEEIETVSGGIDWNAVGTQAMQGAAAGATVGWATGFGAVPLAVGGGLIGGGLAAWQTWNQTTMKPK